MAAKITHMAYPVYPEIAKAAHVSGTVVLHCVISKDGSVKDMKVVSGPDLLVGAAMDAVKQWKYQPTLLNGRPVEVDTTISVVFTLADGSAGGASGTVSNSAAPNGSISVVVPKQPPAAVPIDPQLKASIAKLLDIMHATALMQQIVATMVPQVRPKLVAALPPTAHREEIADAYFSEVTALLESQETLDRIAAVYASYFSLDDINAMIQFYQTPTGQHVLDAMPKVAAESQHVGADIVRENLSRILGELCKEYPELNGKVKFCPTATQKDSGSLSREPKSAPEGAMLSTRGAQ